MGLNLAPVDADFEIDGPPEYSPDGWDLDRLTIPFRGPYSTLQDFIDARTDWESSPIDGTNFFLSDFSSDGHKQWPTVRLVYKGKRGGVLPPDRHSSGRAIQQARYSSATGKTSVEISYNAYFTEKKIWDRTEIDVGAVGPVDPADADVFWFVAVTTEGATLPGDETAALAFFAQRIVTTGPSDEVVPGEYFTATATKQTLLFSILL